MRNTIVVVTIALPLDLLAKYKFYIFPVTHIIKLSLCTCLLWRLRGKFYVTECFLLIAKDRYNRKIHFVKTLHVQKDRQSLWFLLVWLGISKFWLDSTSSLLHRTFRYMGGCGHQEKNKDQWYPGSLSSRTLLFNLTQIYVCVRQSIYCCNQHF